MAIYLLTYNPPVLLPDMTDESLAAARLFGEHTITPIPMGMRRDIRLNGRPGRLELRTMQSSVHQWVDTVAELYVYENEAEMSFSGAAEKREPAAQKERLVETKIVDEEHPQVPIARFHLGENCVMLEHIITYEPSRGKGDNLTEMSQAM